MPPDCKQAALAAARLLSKPPGTRIVSAIAAAAGNAGTRAGVVNAMGFRHLIHLATRHSFSLST